MTGPAGNAGPAVARSADARHAEAESPDATAVFEVAVDEDHHVHSGWSDDATGTLAEVLAAASACSRITISDHVRRATPWLPEYAVAVRKAAAAFDGLVTCAVEAKMLDSGGRMDVPPVLPEGVERVLIADHQWPSPDGPVTPSALRELIEAGRRRPEDAVADLVAAMCAAMERVPRPQLAHPFSVLPKSGIDEALVTAEHLDALADAALRAGAVVELNEKWRCPSARIAGHLAARGVRLVAASDSHRPETVGRFSWVGNALAGAAGS